MRRITIFAGKMYFCKPMKSFNKTGFIIIGQIVFFACFLWFFLNNSFLRPRREPTVECLFALMIIAAMILNYWLFYPLFFIKHSFRRYALMTVLEAVLIAFIEYRFTISYTLRCMPPEAESSVKRTFLLNLFFRDISLLTFFGLMANNIGQKYKLLRKDILLWKWSGQIEAKSHHGDEHQLIIGGDICYVIQRENYSYIYTKDGQQYDRRGSLSFFEKIMADIDGVKISRNTIIFLPYVQDFKGKCVTISKEGSAENVTLRLGNSVPESTIHAIDDFLQKRKNDTTVQEEGGDQDNSFATKSVTTENHASAMQTRQRKQNPKIVVVQEYIMNHPNCNIKDIVSETRIPKSTVTRLLAELKNDGLIRYEGSKKTGGYRVTI